MKIVVVSGGFDPIHSGHIAYFANAKKLGDSLVVALNSDDWLKKKKGKYFMDFDERFEIINNLKMVDEVISFKDDDQGSCCNALLHIKDKYPEDQIIFANGGDRNQGNIPEMQVKGIDFRFSVGGDNKKNSSSWILKNYKYEFEDRIWGRFYNLFNDDVVKVKELIVSPKKGLSFQKHFFRSEIWFVSKGSCVVNYSEGAPDDYKEIILKKDETIFIKKEAWHQIINPNNEPCHIIEIQYGKKTVEEDIERLHYYNEK
jgi:cytidyltransferase-like protein